jgi:hypothetical protein
MSGWSGVNLISSLQKTDSWGCKCKSNVLQLCRLNLSDTIIMTLCSEVRGCLGEVVPTSYYLKNTEFCMYVHH